MKLTDKLSSLPSSPGVYLFKDSAERIIYVGKAKVLRHRVRSYFQKGDDGRYQYSRLVKAIADLEVIITDTEMEALILENNLIKKHTPRYNVDLRDNKTYPYIQVTAELYPRIFITRKTPKDGSKYYGPFTDVKALRDLLRTAKIILRLRNCNRAVTPEEAAQKKYRPCLNYHIGRCAGACGGLISVEDYAHNVKLFVDLIQGRDTDLAQHLHQEMEKASEELRFEEAASWRDRLKTLENFRQRQKVESADPIDRDVIALATEDEDGCAVLFQVRAGRLIGRSHFYLTRIFEKPLPEVLQAFLQEYYALAEVPPEEIFLPFDLDDADLLSEWLSQIKGRRVRLEAPKIGDKARLVRLAAQNAELLLGELKLQRSKKDFIHHALKSLQRDLNLPRAPRRIEAFDVSNIQGGDAVASMVCFQDAKPAKSQYRRFKIKTIQGADDFAMLAETLSRHYQRVLKEKLPLPDLILVDGGKGQLNRAVEVLGLLKLEKIPVAGLAKKLEEVFLPGFHDPQNIPKNSSALKLLCHVRDEAHRFAITYHRLLRKHRTLYGELDAIPGIGAARKKALLRHFGSLKKLKEAEVEAISTVPGISADLAQQVHQKLRTPTAAT